MSLIRKYNSFPFFPSVFDDELTRSMSKWPGTMHYSASIPAVNITETENQFQIEVAAPGMNKEDFKVELENNILTISSDKEEKKEVSDEKGKFTRKEFSYHSFTRSFSIPEKLIEQSKISGKYENGILQILLPKKEHQIEKPNKQIQIQ
ncbi:MAG: Hsp20/alpha crystallin family protein [Flavobacteriales bacterium]|nr:Hsp20/alpha crystallin family protein [Flavobacteriales bacterium]